MAPSGLGYLAALGASIARTTIRWSLLEHGLLKGMGRLCCEQKRMTAVGRDPPFGLQSPGKGSTGLYIDFRSVVSHRSGTLSSDDDRVAEG